jgi:hypothetical protein
MSDAAPQAVPGAAAAANALAQRLTSGSTLKHFRSLLNKHIDKVNDAVTPLTQVSKLFGLQDGAISELLLRVPDYLQHLQQRINSKGPDRLTSKNAAEDINRLLLLLNKPCSPEISLTAVLTAAQLQQVRAALLQGVEDLKDLARQQQPAAAAEEEEAEEGLQLRSTPAKRNRTQVYADPGSGSLSGRQSESGYESASDFKLPAPPRTRRQAAIPAVAGSVLNAAAAAAAAAAGSMELEEEEAAAAAAEEGVDAADPAAAAAAAAAVDPATCGSSTSSSSRGAQQASTLAQPLTG